MGLSPDGYEALCYSLASFLLACMTVYALYFGYRFRNKNSSTEAFITARGQVSMWRIAWSFYAGAVGAWVITGPANYATFAGIIGLVMYAVSSGLPVIMIAYAGDLIQKKVPHVLSLTDFIGWRYGWVAKTYVVLLCLFNMSIALLAEYTTMGSALFAGFVGSAAWPIIVMVGVLTNIYTVYGGLVVSIYTDQIQGIVSIIFYLVIGIYMAAKFRPGPLENPPPCPNPVVYPEDMTTPIQFCISGTYEWGYSSFFSMPASLFTATVFSEAMWQRAWASSTRQNLRRGAWIGCVGIVIVVFFAGLCGLLGAWAGLITNSTNPNLYMLTTLTGAMNEYGLIANWMGVMVVLLAVTMNMSAVDSLQNGLAAAISSHMFKGCRHSLALTRVAVIIVNIPIMVLGTQNYTVLQIFLLSNMLCCTSAVPVLLGLVERLHRFVGGASMLASCLISFAMTSVFGVNYYFTTVCPAVVDGICSDDNSYLSSYFFTNAAPTRTVGDGMHYTWLGNGYAWRFFLVPICVSLGAMILFGSLNYLWQLMGRAKPAVPGFIAGATHPDLCGPPPGSTDSEKHDKSDSNFIVDPAPM